MSQASDFLRTFAQLSFQGFKDEFYHKRKTLTDAAQQEILFELNRNGVVVIPDYYSAEKSEALARKIDVLLEKYDKLIWKDELGADKRIFGAEYIDDDIAAFYSDPFLHQIGEAYHQADMINSLTLASRLNFVDGNLGSGGGWHRDSVYQHQYKSIVYLSDVSEQNGPFQYVVGTHKKETVYTSLKYAKEYVQNRLTSEQVNEFLKDHSQFELKTFTAKKGTLILVDTRGIHRGKPIEQGNRYTLFNYYYPKHHYTDSQKAKFDGIRIKNKITADR